LFEAEAPAEAAGSGSDAVEVAVSLRPEVRIPSPMHIATVHMRVKEDKRLEALSAIDGFIHRMHMWPGCLTCRLMSDAGDTQLLTLVSEWDSREALDGFLSSREFLILQGMRMVLRDEPQVILDEILLRSRMPLNSRSR
jgi:quinol monooxygenase YgiN